MREIALGEIQGEQVIAPRGSRNSAHVMCQRLHEMGYLRERLGFDGRKYFEPAENYFERNAKSISKGEVT